MAPAKVRQPRRPLSAFAALLGVAVLLGLLAGRLPAYVPSSPPGRRGALGAGAAAGLAGLAPPLTLGSLPARAEQPWQLQLPRTWRSFSQTPQPPPGELKPAALVVAGNPEIEGELAVLRVPLSSDPKDPNAAATKDLVKYFSAPAGQSPGVGAEKVVEAVAASQRTTPRLTKFALVGKPVEQTKGNRRYVRYEYESSLCQGNLVQGVNGNVCQRPESEELEPTLDRRHTITLTVTPEDTKGATNFLWLLDVSGPSKAWDALSEEVGTVSGSFELGTEEQLERDRTADVTKEQLEALKELQKAGKLPQDGQDRQESQDRGFFGFR
mmetsp:Transcript_34139/g.98297  ORF Transcript_34139/g.98297 Transcript_34139/m.98297 type:complete len:325 (+) Transcript_34139:27-1001(+)